MGCKTTGEQEDFSLKTKEKHEHGKHPVTSFFSKIAINLYAGT